MGKLDGKVAFITGAARGQGRSHALRLAEEGAAIIATDICEPIGSVPYSLSTRQDLDAMVAEVRALGGQILAEVADVRDFEATRAVVEAGVERFGRLDIVVANAGIASNAMPMWEFSEEQFRDQIDVNLTGVWRTIKATVPLMIAQGTGGAVVLTSSLNGLVASLNMGHYVASKHGVEGLMKTLAAELAPHMIRVNTVCPTNVNTPMLNNSWMNSLFTGGRDDAIQEDAIEALASVNSLPIPFVMPVDISNAIVHLVSDEGRFITGSSQMIDAGAQLPMKAPKGPIVRV